MINYIGHCDLDAFHASVEELLNPELKKIPFGVYDPERGTPITATNYRAKRLGIDSGMRISDARKICFEKTGHDFPLVRAHPEKYEEMSDGLFSILKKRNNNLEWYSEDEAFLPYDLTFQEAFIEMRETLKEVREKLHLPVSGSVAKNKWLAKMATNLTKPSGFLALPKEDSVRIFYPLPVENAHGTKGGIGRRLRSAGVQTIGDINDTPLSNLIAIVGSVTGTRLYYLSRGIDHSPLRPWYVEISDRSIGNTIRCNFPYSAEHIKSRYRLLCLKIERRMREGNYHCRTVTISMRFRDDGLTMVQKSKSLPEPNYFDNKEIMYMLIEELFPQLYIPGKKVDRAGMKVSNLVRGWSQLRLL